MILKSHYIKLCSHFLRQGFRLYNILRLCCFLIVLRYLKLSNLYSCHAHPSSGFILFHLLEIATKHFHSRAFSIVLLLLHHKIYSLSRPIILCRDNIIRLIFKIRTVCILYTLYVFTGYVELHRSMVG